MAQFNSSKSLAFRGFVLGRLLSMTAICSGVVLAAAMSGRAATAGRKFRSVADGAVDVRLDTL